MDNLEQLKPYHNVAAFYVAAMRICKKRGIKYNFPCPLCGGVAHAKKTIKYATINAYCEGCNIKIKEQ